MYPSKQTWLFHPTLNYRVSALHLNLLHLWNMLNGIFKCQSSRTRNLLSLMAEDLGQNHSRSILSSSDANEVTVTSLSRLERCSSNFSSITISMSTLHQLHIRTREATRLQKRSLISIVRFCPRRELVVSIYLYPH